VRIALVALVLLLGVAPMARASDRDALHGYAERTWASLKAMTIMAALGNALGGDVLRHGFADRGLERALRPVIGIERFNVPGG
jgi:hypothetical protein